MRTVGVDLSAEARHTGIAVIDWHVGRAQVIDVRVGADDKAVLASMHAADKTALDCPLGWPEPFVEFLVAHRDGHVTVPVDVPGLAWRRTLSRRTTDLHVAALTGVTPLSVAADRIAAVAVRAAGLLSVLAQQGQSVDRAGAGQVVEVYPAAALKCWHLPFQTYKGPLFTAKRSAGSWMRCWRPSPCSTYVTPNRCAVSQMTLSMPSFAP